MSAVPLPLTPRDERPDDGLAALADGDVLHDDGLLAAGFQALQRQAPRLRHVKEPRGGIREAGALDRREAILAILGEVAEQLHARVMHRGDLVREHFLKTGFRAGRRRRIERRREHAGLGGRVRAVLGGIDADDGGLLKRAEDVLPGAGEGLWRDGRGHQLMAGVADEGCGPDEEALAFGAQRGGLLGFQLRVHAIKGPTPVELLGGAERLARLRRRGGNAAAPVR